MEPDTTPKISRICRIELERFWPHPVERVWKALTTEAEISAWMKFPAQLDLRVGGAIHVDFGKEGSLDGVVCAVQEPGLFTYTWGDSLVKWKPEAGSDFTRLRFSHVGVKPEFLTGLTAGWQCFLDQLASYLSGIPTPDRYRELEKRYEAELKPLL